ncbi:MAG: hypothetical protein WC934_02855 [Acidithiobacillus sp.]|jgi:hypothetical protein|uniref:hypothetical protein n=1 Tax=Acidithiobacillus sp. TaxID=1872118 RepID=UPI003560BDEB
MEEKNLDSKKKRKNRLPSENKLIQNLELRNCEELIEIETPESVLQNPIFKQHFDERFIPSKIIKAKSCDLSKLDKLTVHIGEAQLYCPSGLHNPLKEIEDVKDISRINALKEKFGAVNGEFFRFNDQRSYRGNDEINCRVGLKIKTHKNQKEFETKIYNIKNVFARKKRSDKELKALGLDK